MFKYDVRPTTPEEIELRVESRADDEMAMRDLVRSPGWAVLQKYGRDRLTLLATRAVTDFRLKESGLGEVQAEYKLLLEMIERPFDFVFGKSK